MFFLSLWATGRRPHCYIVCLLAVLFSYTWNYPFNNSLLPVPWLMHSIAYRYVLLYRSVFFCFYPSWGCGALTFKMHSACATEQRNSCTYVKALKFIIYLQENWSTQHPKRAFVRNYSYRLKKAIAVFVCYIIRKHTTVLFLLFLHNWTILRLNCGQGQK